MRPYTETLAVLASIAETRAVAVFTRWESGDLTDEEFVALVTAVLWRECARGVALADVALATVLSVSQGSTVLPVALDLPGGHENQLRTAARATVAAGLTRDAVGVLARAETLAASQDAYSEGMRRHGVPAWTRVLNSGACELCQDLAGDVLPGDAPMFHHKGCGCTQRPVLNPEGTSA